MNELQPGQTLEQAVEAADKVISELFLGKREEYDLDAHSIITTALLAQTKRIEELETTLAEANEAATRIAQEAVAKEREECARFAQMLCDDAIHPSNQWAFGYMARQIRARQSP